MTVSKMDYKKEYKDLYMPGKKPGRVTVPEIAFVMADGAGAPESACYQNALSALYAISFGIKMKKCQAICQRVILNMLCRLWKAFGGVFRTIVMTGNGRP